MTINKKLSFVAAATLVSVSAFAAGTLATNPETMATELVKDSNVTVASDVNATYIPELNAGINDGKFVINLTNATINDANVSTLYIYNKKQGKIVTKDGTQATGNNGAKIIFDINDSINSGDTLYLVEGNTTTSTNTTPKTDMNLTISKNATTASMTMELVNNNDTTLDTSNSKEIMTMSPEWSVSIKKSFNGLIDASNKFGQFINNTDDTTTTDTAAITVTKATGITHGANISNLYVYVKPDTNVSTMGTFVLNDGSTTTKQAASFEYNTTVSNIGADRDINASFTDNNLTKMLPTSFFVSAKLDGVVGNLSSKSDLLTSTKFGAWKIYGYNAKIPNVASTSAVDVTMKFTNRSGIDSNIYFTLIDPAGHTVDLSSEATPGLASLAKGTTEAYKASALVALIPDGTTFDHTGSFSIEVSVPTTPTSVYGMASFKNKTLGQFKMLPIYNNSDLHY